MPETDRSIFDLDAYLQRVGMSAPIRPDLPALREILRMHADAIPFENLDSFLGKPVDLDFAAVQKKLVDDGRGGYCFEQNLLLGEALRAIGFAVTNLAARVLWGQADDAITARSHMLLRVELEGDAWLADAGFGGTTPTGPVQFNPDVEQSTPHEPFRLQRCSEDDWRLQVCIDDGWKSLYFFDLQPQYPVDYRVSNWWTSTHPDSHFVSGLTAARAPAGRRLALRNRDFAVHVIGGETEKRKLRNVGEIRDVLQREFRIRMPQSPALDHELDCLPD